MAEIFLSYAREDSGRIQPIIAALQEQGWQVFWDRRIPAGQTWRTYIGKAMDEARCLIVVWSRDSVNSSWVIEEADEGRRRGILVPVLLDVVEQPHGFREIQAANLADWQPGQPFPQIGQFLDDVRSVLGASRGATSSSDGRPAAATSKPLPARPFWRPAIYGAAGIIAVVLTVVAYLIVVRLKKTTVPAIGAQPIGPQSVDRDQPIGPQSVDRDQQHAVVLVQDPGPYHLGDQELRGWSKRYALCWETHFSGSAMKTLELRLRTFGVENGSIRLNTGIVGALPREPSEPGQPRPNYWSSERPIPLPVRFVHDGLNTLQICAEPVSDPEFPGDRDDFQVRDIVLVAEH